jgi:Mg-chelatase subunit ChlD
MALAAGPFGMRPHHNLEETQMSKATLSEYDFIIAIDASGSMGETDTKNGRSRWDYAQETITAFARDLSALDSDGIDVITFGGTSVTAHTGVNADTVKDVFASRSPRGSTPLAEALTAALEMAGKSDKKDFILVLTDGVPDDKAAAAKVIVDAANLQETDDALTILFIQVGNDRDATNYLRNLDDNLTGAKFDIVDVKTVEEAEAFSTTTDLVLAAIND